MMSRERNTLIFLLTVIVVLYLLEKLWQYARALGSLVMIFAMAWLIAFIFRPVVDWLHEGLVPKGIVEWAREKWGDRPARYLAVVRLPYGISATLVYVVLLGLLVVAVIAFVPVVVNQSVLLAANLRNYADQTPAWLNSLQETLAYRFNLDPQQLSQLYTPEQLVQEISKQVTSIGPSLMRGTVGTISVIASAMGELLLVLALSYYIMLDGRRVSDQFYRLVPERYQDEVQFATRTLDKTFGGFLRGQVLMAAISGVVTAVAASAAGLPYEAVIGAICGVLMFIPLIGAPIAMVLPSIIALLGGDTGAAIGLFVFVTIFQQILLHFLVPKIMSESLGMPSLLVLASVLIGVQMIGVSGFIFAIPVAAAIYAIGVVVLERYKRQLDSLEEDEK